MNLDQLTLPEIEHKIISAQTNAQKSRKEFIETLYYLESTKRFRDDKVYKDSSFQTYIQDKFNLRLTTYNNEKFAFLKFPKESTKFGPGLINKVKEKCGVSKVKEVMGIIGKEKISREKIEKIIQKNSKPEEPKKPEPTNSALQSRIAFLEAENLALTKTVQEKDAQIEKLKKTIDRLKRYEKVMCDLQNVVYPARRNISNSKYKESINA